MDISIEILLLVISLLFFLSILAGKASSRFGVPALVLFLGVGMLCGSDGLGIQFEDIGLAQKISTVALCIILFSGGLDTKISEVKPVLAPGVALATMGVLLTALVSGLIIYLIMWLTNPGVEFTLLTSLLLAATMSSTDSSSVFSILRSKGLHLKHNLRPMLELESGSNDPLAYILVTTLTQLAVTNTEQISVGSIALTLLMQIIIGATLGLLIGKAAIWVINHIKIDNDELYPILVFTFCLFIFSITYLLHGNSYLAIYLAGLVMGNSKFIHKRSSLNFFDELAWMSQLLMFLVLGLLVNPHELIPLIIPGLIISLVMIFIARPAAVFITLLPFRKITLRDKGYISWVGLRGAVPIIFAIMPLAANVPEARTLFNLVFLCTLVSLLLQGTSLAKMAEWMNLVQKPKVVKKVENFDVDFSDDLKSITTEIEIVPEALHKGNKLMDIALPENTLVVMIRRQNNYFIPKGNTALHVGDKLLVITTDHQSLQETYRQLHVKV
ncbi:MAG: potassium/proton antiporter [Bacteroidales bacterium]|nr:potassium/proton antiporter [Bacteroidales bacterium]